MVRSDQGAHKNILTREIKILQQTWSVGSAFSAQFNPLLDLVKQPVLQHRLYGYSCFRFKAIELRVVYNASPQRAGILMGSWTPLNCHVSKANRPLPASTSTEGEAPNFSGGVSLVEQGLATIPGCANTDFGYVMQRSQRSAVLSHISTNDGFVYRIPWRHYADALVMDDLWPDSSTGAWSGSANFLNEFYNFGYYTLESLGLQLRGSDDTAGVTVMVYAKFVEPEVWNPTYATQSGVFADPIQVDTPEAGSRQTVGMTAKHNTEALQNKPSTVASAVADAMDNFKFLPYIGGWATSGSMVARLGARIARSMGWSNPPLLQATSVEGLTTNVFSTCPSLSRQDPIFALDPHNEVSIDPTLTGGPAVDELEISALCARPCVLDTVTWSYGDLTGQLLMSIPVSPNHCIKTVVNNTAASSVDCVRLQMPPYTYFSQLFRHWRGTFCVEIIPVVSMFSKGSIRVWWEPVFRLAAVNFKEGEVIHTVHDISNGPLVFKVPYAAARGMLEVDTSPYDYAASYPGTIKYWGKRAVASPTQYDALTVFNNGVVNIQTVNALNGELDVDFVIRTWFEDMQLAVPNSVSDLDTGPSATWCSNFVTQAAVVSVEAESSAKHVGLLYTGEVVKSLRTLVNRSQLWRMQTWSPGSVNFFYSHFDFPRFPTSRGSGVRDDYAHGISPMKFDTTGIGENGAVLNSNLSYTTHLAYIARCFVGHRGSILWRILPLTSADSDHLHLLSRVDCQRGNSPSFGQFYYASSGTVDQWKFFRHVCQKFLGSSGAGMMTSTKVDRVLSGLFPSYLNVRMCPGDDNHATDSCKMTLTQFGSYVENVSRYGGERLRYSQLGMGPQSTNWAKSALLSVQAGPDWTPIEFLSVPDIFVGGTLVNPAVST